MIIEIGGEGSACACLCKNIQRVTGIFHFDEPLLAEAARPQGKAHHRDCGSGARCSHHLVAHIQVVGHPDRPDDVLAHMGHRQPGVEEVRKEAALVHPDQWVALLDEAQLGLHDPWGNHRRRVRGYEYPSENEGGLLGARIRSDCGIRHRAVDNSNQVVRPEPLVATLEARLRPSPRTLK